MLAVATVLLALLGAAWRCSGSGAGGPAAVEAEGRLLSGADGSRVGVCSFTNRSDEPQTISLAGTSCSCIRMNLTTDPWPLAPSETTTRVVWETKSSESPSSSATAFVSVSVRAGDLADTIRLRVW
jgi:hypothetical protein